ncbi:hypothetical protein [Bradyrhizobium sp. LHD-71]|uniref:hypothetical protein n=1 Tax=Bradyrhizobium sp. LHD-71 TaxID=3072141 RepID=UPI00280CFE81|nr:hypothetical protein [Bradyrhizobium sp. LHD-71]MDQ8732311.1 hypothetical protein [Bradyrhizobium sp. LHD-71]
MTDVDDRRNWNMVVAVLALVWAGLVIGVSGLATPVKFNAPSLTLPVALDVGRVTFNLLARVEWGLATALVLSGIAARVSYWRWLLIALVVAIVLAQSFWLLPALDARVSAVIAGTPLPPSSLHGWYVAGEAMKIGALTLIGLGALWRVRRVR